MRNFALSLFRTSLTPAKISVFKYVLMSAAESPRIRRLIFFVATLGATFSDELYSLLLDKQLSLHFISAPNLFTGGPLTILIDCLASIPDEMKKDSSRVILLCSSEVYLKLSLPAKVYPLCLPLSRSSWFIRLYYERIGFYILSCLCNVHTWVSLHDFTSNVKAKYRYTYYHNPTPFWLPQLRHIIFAPGLLLWKLFYFPLAAWGIDRNDSLIVQQHWLKYEFTKRFPRLRVLVMPPIAGKLSSVNLPIKSNYRALTNNNVLSTYCQVYSQPPPDFIFFYPCIPRVFKNIELAIESVLAANTAGFACSLLVTISGDENVYSRYLKLRYGKQDSIKFIGYQNRQEMDALYKSVDALLFTSLLETWGLPMSEAQSYSLPIVAIDLPYVRETAKDYPYLYLSSDKNLIDLARFYTALDKDSFTKPRTLPLPSLIMVPNRSSEIDWYCLWQAVASSRRLLVS